MLVVEVHEGHICFHSVLIQFSAEKECEKIIRQLFQSSFSADYSS